MKANLKGNREKALEEVWQSTQDSIHFSNTVILIAVAEHFGLGKKRMERFIKFYNEVAKTYIEYERDGIHIDKINEALKKFGTDFDSLFKHETYREAERDVKINGRSRQVDYANAILAQKRLKQFAGYIEEVNDNGKQ